MIVKHECPIMEYDTKTDALIQPMPADIPFPRLCLATFFKEVFDKVIAEYKGIRIGAYRSEMSEFPVYRIMYQEKELCIVQAVVGSGSIEMMTEWLYGKGVETILCCGGCGVLDHIPSGDVILPVKALRDEGASYKYLPPSRFVEVSKKTMDAIRSVLKKYEIPYMECATWTTEAMYRETRDMIEYRKSEGCMVVEMECATMAAIAKFRHKEFGMILYSGDLLAGKEYNDREWYNKFSAREKLFYITLEAICLL